MRKKALLILPMLLLFALLTSCYFPEFLLKKEQLGRKFFDTGVVPRLTENFITELTEDLKKEAGFTAENIVYTENKTEEHEEDDDWRDDDRYQSHGLCLLRKNGFEIAVDYILRPTEMEGYCIRYLNLSIKSGEYSSPDEIGFVPDALTNAVNKILERFDPDPKPFLTVDKLASFMNREYLIENFDQNAFVVCTNEDASPCRYEASYRRSWNRKEYRDNIVAEYKVCRKITDGKETYNMEFTLETQGSFLLPTQNP